MGVSAAVLLVSLPSALLALVLLLQAIETRLDTAATAPLDGKTPGGRHDSGGQTPGEPPRPRSAPAAGGRG